MLKKPSTRSSVEAMTIEVGARGSKLSQLQVEEIHREIIRFHPHLKFLPMWTQTTGDKDLKTPLSSLGKTDFFTKEIDTLLLQGSIRVGIHSAKDLPEPLPEGLAIVAITKGLDPSDSLVFRAGDSLETLPKGARIGTSSLRRMQTIKELREDLVCSDIRGTIENRLAQLDKRKYDAIIVAECALIRLKLTHRNRIRLPGLTAPHQGQLAVIARKNDEEMREIFKSIDSR